MSFFSGKKLILFGMAIILLIAIPITVYFAQQQQEIRSRANPSTTLSLCAPGTNAANTCTSAVSAQVGQTFSLDVMMNPGSNVVTFMKLDITYDPTLIATADAQPVVGNSAVVSPFGSPTFNNGELTVSYGIIVNPSVADPTKALQSSTKVATLTFKPLAATPRTQISFGQPTQVLSSNTAQDAQGENVLSSSNPATVAITGGLTPTPTPGPQAANQPPVCTALNLDRAVSGSAPYSVTFTANGNDTDGTISKITFNFGDGPVQDITQAGGIGTNSVSSQVAHTYNNAGTYQASAVLTDNQNAVSSAAACLKTITVAAGAAGSGSSGSSASGSAPVVIATPTPVVLALSPTPTMAPSGPGGKVLTIGTIGALMSIVGALVFLAL